MPTPIPEELLVGHRLAVDQEFATRVRDSEFSSMEWDLIMSSVTFELANPDDPEEAAIVADLEEVWTAIDAIDDLPDRQPGVKPSTPHRGSREPGVLSRLSSSLGLDDVWGGGPSDERIQSANALVTEYAEVLQIHLKQQHHWEELCERVESQSE